MGAAQDAPATARMLARLLGRFLTGGLIVSSLGWPVTRRAALRLAGPEIFVSVADAIGARCWWMMTQCIVFAPMSPYLTYIGWSPARGRPTSPARAVRGLPWVA
ncbi:MAG: hypothetical protein PHQ28_15130 [Mycobacterium sp.]|nr:hypothetical protein [Mycobacterium sp.]